MERRSERASTTHLHGADPALVRCAVDTADPLPGSRGFAGQIDERLVRDVLGRVPLFLDSGDPDQWAFDHAELDDPVPVPAGHVVDPDGTRHRIWSLPEYSPHQATAAVGAVREAIEASLAAVRTDGLAIAFSGGVDSALLAGRLEAPLYVTGFPDSPDLRAARKSARLLDRDLRVVELDHDMLLEAIPRVATAIDRTNAMDVAIALPLFVLAERAAADGFARLAVGQGADELFGGYAKIAQPATDSRVRAATVRGARREILESLPDQLRRDVLTVWAAGVEPVAPLLADQVVRAGLRVPGSLLVSERGDRKYALRLMARNWLPDSIAFREKKALQYGSLVARELDRLARQAGFKRRLDDHVSQYVQSLLE